MLLAYANLWQWKKKIEYKKEGLTKKITWLYRDVIVDGLGPAKEVDQSVEGC